MNFSDATVAIAITVLMLPLVDIALEIEKLSLGDLLAANLGTIIAFAITFAVIARLWFSHHRLFEAASEWASTFAVNGITTMLASQRKLIQIAPLS